MASYLKQMVLEMVPDLKKRHFGVINNDFLKRGCDMVECKLTFIIKSTTSGNKFFGPVLKSVVSLACKQEVTQLLSTKNIHKTSFNLDKTIHPF
jgi:hypothetical protein